MWCKWTGVDLSVQMRMQDSGVLFPPNGLPDEVGSDAIPEAAGGEGSHGAAKPDGVIHRYTVKVGLFQIPITSSPQVPYA
jgi:hypothetical protein